MFKAQYFLPYNETQLRPTRFERDVGHMMVDKYGQAFESYDVEAKVKSGEYVSRQDVAPDDDVRSAIYQTLEFILHRNNIDGRRCVMRAICEASRLPFTHESGLLGEIFHVLFV